MLFVIGNSMWLIALALLNNLPFWLLGMPGIVLQAVGCVGLLHLVISSKPSWVFLYKPRKSILAILRTASA